MKQPSANFLVNLTLGATNFLLSFLLSAKIASFIKIPFTNTYLLLSPLTQIQYNPFNNYLKFVAIITLTIFFFLIFYLLVFKTIEQKITKYFLLSINLYIKPIPKLQTVKNLLFTKKVKFLFVCILSAFYFLSKLEFYIQKITNIDMFHDGEQIGLAAAVHFFDKIPYKDIFFFHGAFADPLFGKLAFEIFGTSIGSYYVLGILVETLTAFSILLLLFLIIKNHVLFYVASIFIFGSISLSTNYENLSLGRDLFVSIVIYLVFLLLKKKIPNKIALFSISFVSFFTLFHSIDRGFYLLISTFIFTFIFSFISKDKINFWLNKKILSESLKNLSAYLLGVATALIIGLWIFTYEGMKNFLQMTFVDLPKFQSVIFDYQYPEFSLKFIYPHWWPILILAASYCFVIYYLFQNRNVQKMFLFVFFNLVLATISFKSGLGRSDLGHITYVMHFIFLTCFVLFDYLFSYTKTKLEQKMIVWILIIGLFFLPFFKLERFTDLSRYNNLKVLRDFRHIPKVDDQNWLTPEQDKVRTFIIKNTKENDYVYDFTNQASYYYLFKRQSPSRFYMPVFASPNFYQTKLLKDLQTNPPKYIIYKTDYFSYEIDGIPNDLRLPLINKWILSNYKTATVIDSTEIVELISAK